MAEEAVDMSASLEEFLRGGNGVEDGKTKFLLVAQNRTRQGVGWANRVCAASRLDENLGQGLKFHPKCLRCSATSTGFSRNI